MVGAIAGSGDTPGKVRSEGPEEAADPFRSRAVILGGDLAGDTDRGEKIVDADGDQAAGEDLHHLNNRRTDADRSWLPILRTN